MSAPDASERTRLRRGRSSARNGPAGAAQRIANELAGGTGDEVARRLRVLGHPTRLALIVELAAGSRSVAELAAAVGIDPAAASKHLRELQRASMVVRRQDGTHAIYTLADATAVKVLLLVARSVHTEAARITAALRASS